MLVDLDAIPRREPGLEPFEVMISRVPGADGRDRGARPLGGRAGRLRALGPAGGDHRPGHRGAGHRRPHRPRRARRAGRRRPPGATGSRSSPASPPAPWRPRPSSSSASPARPPAVARPPRRARPAEPVDHLPVRGQDPGAVLLALLGSPNLSSRRSVFEQYDHNVQANTVAGPGRGAAVIRIKGTTKALVATTDGNATGRARWTRGWAPRCRSPRRRATCPSPAPGRWA